MLKGKNVFITGTNRGIGRAILKECAANGASIWAHARKETPEFVSFLEETSKKYDVVVRPVYFDMTDKEAMKKAVMEIRSSKLPVDALINNAGMMHNASFQMSSEKALRDVFEVNFFATFLLTQYIANLMVRQKHGSIVTVSSMGALDGNPGKAVYGASKAALVTMSRVIANELGAQGIRSNCIAPGVIETDILQTMPESEVLKAKDLTPMKRLGLPEEVASTAVFLASDKSSFINGQVIRVDGGLRS